MLSASDARADREPLHEVYLSEFRRLAGLARLLARDGDDPEEVVQEAFARAWARRRWIREDVLAYVQRTVVNLSRSRLRRHRVAAAHRPARPDDVESAEAGVVRRAQRTAVVASIRELPRRQRECIVLRYYSDLTVPEIAARLGLAEGSVKSHLHRATATLASNLEAHR